MPEPVQTKNFGNEVQPQSSATQTSFSIKPKPPKQQFTFIERPDQRHYSRHEEFDYERTPSPELRQDPRMYPRHEEIEYEQPSPPPPPPPCYRWRSSPSYYETREQPSPPRRTRIPTDRPFTPSPPRLSRHPSPYRRPQSATPRSRPLMFSQETDTSLDAMKSQQHRGVQYEPTPTREKGTQPSIRLKRPTPRPPTSYLSITSPVLSLPRRHPSPETTSYYIQPTDKYYRNTRFEDDEEQQQVDVYDDDDDEEHPPSMHDQSTMADLIVSLDHYTQCDSQPYMADHFVQTSPTNDEDEQSNDRNSIRGKLPLRRSISISQSEVVQPPTLPRPRRSQYSPTRAKRDGIDYTGKNLEVSLHHGLQRQTSTRDSPLLNIGTQHVLEQLPTNEYTIPFETRYIYDSMRSSKQNSTIVAPVLNSSRTHLLTYNPVQQSRTNGNFFLSTPSARSINSSFRLHMTTDEY